MDAENTLGVRIGTHLHVVLKMHAPLRLAGTARRIQPEGRRVAARRLGLERRGGGGDQRLGQHHPKRTVTDVVSEHDDMAEGLAVCNGGRSCIQQLGACDDYPRRRIAEHELVVGCRPTRVQRHRDRTDLDRAEEGRDHLRAVAHQDEHPLFGAHVERRLQRVADPVDLLEQLPVGQSAIDAFDRDPGFTAVPDVAVDEVSGSVEHQGASRHSVRSEIFRAIVT